jgi:hypothetical protein
MKTSFIKRSEKWVHISAQEALEQAKFKRNSDIDAWVLEQQKIRLINDSKNWFVKWFFGLQTSKDEVQKEDCFYWYDPYRADIRRLKQLISGTDNINPSSHLMFLSVEDSSLIEEYLKEIS